jgi:Sigma-70, region 4
MPARQQHLTTTPGDRRLNPFKPCRRPAVCGLVAALEGLPEDQREVLVLRHIAGLTPGEIALRLGKSEAAVHGLHHRGRASLRVALSELGAAPVTAA